MSQDRDYVAEMNDRMTAAIGDWGTTSAIVAGKLQPGGDGPWHIIASPRCEVHGDTQD